jgi:hypothetical protein
MNQQTLQAWIKQFQTLPSEGQKQAFLAEIAETVRHQTPDEAMTGLQALREQTEDLYRRVQTAQSELVTDLSTPAGL